MPSHAAIGEIGDWPELFTPATSLLQRMIPILAILTAWKGFGQTMIIMLAGLTGISPQYYEAARIDGVSEIGIFFRIMLPLAKTGMIALGIYLLMTNWNDLSYPLILSTDAMMRTLPAGIAMFVGNNQTSAYGPMMAATVISILPLLFIYLFLQKYFITGIAMSGMKD